MKLKKISPALALVLGLGAFASGCVQDNPPAAAADAGIPAAHLDADVLATGHASHQPDTQASAAGVDFPTPGNHEPWTPDAPLVEGMSRVRTALGELHVQPHPDQAIVIARATDIDDAIAYMFANCKLDTDPDVALHAILARLMAGTQALHTNPTDTAPIADMDAAVKNYERLFVDPKSEGAAES